ncbi:MAG: hypothetical protein JNL09_06740 [Anaerolineales bacterium]|nr:hypothetical protein [Anaerolineales bacterium]
MHLVPFLILLSLVGAGSSVPLRAQPAPDPQALDRLVAAAETGLAFGVMETAISAGQILAPLLAGQLYTLNPALPFQVCLVLVVLTFVLAWRVLQPAPTPALQTPDISL